MEKQLLKKYIGNPQVLNKDSLSELQDLTQEFPYFQTAWALLARNLYALDDHRFDELLKMAATCAIDRTRLQQIIFNPQPINSQKLKSSEIEKKPVAPEIQVKEQVKPIVETLAVEPSVDTVKEDSSSPKEIKQTHGSDQRVQQNIETQSAPENISQKPKVSLPSKTNSVQKQRLSLGDQVKEMASDFKNNQVDTNSKESEKAFILPKVEDKKDAEREDKLAEIEKLRKQLKERLQELNIISESEKSTQENEVLVEKNTLTPEQKQDAALDACILTDEDLFSFSFDDEDEDSETTEKLNIEPVFDFSNLEKLKSTSVKVDPLVDLDKKNPENHKQKLLDKFITDMPDMKPSLSKDHKPKPVSEPKVQDSGDFVSETLARIYVSQGHYEKALVTYKKLSLKYPQKNAYFASKIEKIKELIHTKGK